MKSKEILIKAGGVLIPMLFDITFDNVLNEIKTLT